MPKIHMPSKRLAVIGSVAVLAVVVIGYAIFMSYYAFSGRALPHTHVGDLNVGNMSKAEIVTALKEKTDDITVEFTGDDINATEAHLADMGAELDVNASAKLARSAHRSAWDYVSSIFADTNIEPVVNFPDDSRVEAFAQKLTEGKDGAALPTPPKVENQDGTFVIVPGVDGKGIAVDDIKDAARKLVQAQKSISVALKQSTLPAPEPDDALKDLATEANDMVSTEVVVHIAENNVTAEQADKAAWITINDGKPEINRDALHQWVTDKTAPSVVEGVTGIRYVNSNGTVIQESPKAVAAKTATNIDEVVDTIATQMATHTATDVSVNIETADEQWEEHKVSPALQSHQSNTDATQFVYQADPGEKWIDINLSNFTAIGYEGTTAVVGPIPFIPGATSTPTVVGTFRIWHKTPLQTMRGTNADGTPYVTPGVPWIMYFHGDYAIHGAPWRTSFGYDPGNAGSHGCVNVAPSDAHSLYDWAPLGTVVVSHY